MKESTEDIAFGDVNVTIRCLGTGTISRSRHRQLEAVAFQGVGHGVDGDHIPVHLHKTPDRPGTHEVSPSVTCEQDAPGHPEQRDKCGVRHGGLGPRTR